MARRTMEIMLPKGHIIPPEGKTPHVRRRDRLKSMNKICPRPPKFQYVSSSKNEKWVTYERMAV